MLFIDYFVSILHFNDIKHNYKKAIKLNTCNNITT